MLRAFAQNPAGWGCVALILLTMHQTPCLAGTAGILEGIVRDKKTSEVLPGVVVEIQALKRGSTTGPEGRFEFHNIPSATYDVRFALVGYRTLILKGVVVNADLRTRLDVVLESSEISIGEVVVTQQAPLVHPDVTSSAYFVSSNEIHDLPLTSVTDVVGLKAGTTLEGNIRGGRNTEVGYFVDGLPVQNLMSGGLGLQLPPNSVTNLSIYTGGFEAEYGNSLSGVINIVTKTGGNEHEFFLRALEDNLLGGTQVSKEKEVELSASGPMVRDRLFYTLSLDGSISGTRWWQDFERIFAEPIDNQLSGFGKLEYQFSPTMRLDAEVLFFLHQWRDYDFSWRLDLNGLPAERRTAYRFAVILTDSPSESFFYDLSLCNYRARSNIGDGSKNDLPVNNPYQYDFFLQYVISGSEALWMRSLQNTLTAKFDGTWSPAVNHLMKFGAEMNFNDLTSDIVKYTPRTTYFGRPLVNEPQLDFSSTYSYGPRSGGLYISDKIGGMEKRGSLLNVGCRFDFLDPRASRPSINPILMGDTAYAYQVAAPVRASLKYRFSPRVGLGLQATENSYFFINLGFYFQNPLFDYLYTGIDRVALEKGFSALLGNPDLEPEESTQWELSYRYSLPNEIVLSLAYFQKTTTNLIDSKTFVQGDVRIAGTFGFAQFVNVPEASASGLEIVISRDRGKWLTGEVSYTYMVTEGNSGSAFDGFYLAEYGFKPIVRSFPLSWDQRHTVKASIRYASDNGYLLDLVLHWHTGRPYTYYPTSNGFTASPGQDFVQNNARMPDFFNIDFKMQKHFSMDWWSKADFSLFVDIRNLTNEYNTVWMDSNGREGGELGDPSGHTIGRRARFGLQVSF